MYTINYRYCMLKSVSIESYAVHTTPIILMTMGQLENMPQFYVIQSHESKMVNSIF